jgi:hypothetical protein
MFRVLFFALVACCNAQDRLPGFTSSFSESAFKRGADHLVQAIINDIKSIVIPGVHGSFFTIEPIRFDDVSIGSYDVSVVPGQGVQLSLQDVGNSMSHTKLSVGVGLLKCTGEIWAFAKGGAFTAMNTIAVDQDGSGHYHVEVPPGGFDAGDIETHHKMDSRLCEIGADAFHVINSVIIDVVKNELATHFVDILSKIVSEPVNLFLHELQQPPALGFGKEKFNLDNSYLSVSYDGQRMTQSHKGEWKSTAHPQESPLQPDKLPASAGRDVELAFSDYTLNTLFDALFVEHIGEDELRIPFVKTIFDKECSGCPIVTQSTFGKAARQIFAGGKSAVRIQDVMLSIGALTPASQVLPMVTLRVNASAGVAFSFTETAANYAVKATLSLDEFSQVLMVSHIGEIELSGLSRDVKTILTSVLDKINSDVPALPIPTLGGAKLGSPAVVIDEGSIVIGADIVLPSNADSVVLI